MAKLRVGDDKFYYLSGFVRDGQKVSFTLDIPTPQEPMVLFLGDPERQYRVWEVERDGSSWNITIRAKSSGGGCGCGKSA